MIPKIYLLSIITPLIECGHVLNTSTIELPQDINTNVDALIIFIADDKIKELIRIFPHRTLFQRKQIADVYKQMNPNNPLVPKQYVPLRGDPFQDLLFAMVNELWDVVVTFLQAALQSASPEAFATTIIDILVFNQRNLPKITEFYDKHPIVQKSLLETVSTITTNELRHFLLELLTRKPEPEPEHWNTINYKDVDHITQLLLQERQNWANKRTVLDYVLMSKSTTFAIQVMMQFAFVTEDEDIFEAIDTYIYDKILRIGYTNLAKDIRSSDLRMVDRIHDSENGPLDQYATNILLLSTISDKILDKTNLMFTEKYGQCISHYFLDKNSTDPVNQMLAAMTQMSDC